jgi:hypothetical protein
MAFASRPSCSGGRSWREKKITGERRNGVGETMARGGVEAKED